MLMHISVTLYHHVML